MVTLVHSRLAGVHVRSPGCNLLTATSAANAVTACAIAQGTTIPTMMATLVHSRQLGASVEKHSCKLRTACMLVVAAARTPLLPQLQLQCRSRSQSLFLPLQPLRSRLQLVEVGFPAPTSYSFTMVRASFCPELTSLGVPWWASARTLTI